MLLRPLRGEREERGVAMVVVVVLVVLCATVSMVVASSTMFGTQQAVGDRSRLQALSAAEAGRDATLAAVKAEIAAGSCTDGTLYRHTVGDTGEQYAARVYWWDEDRGKPPATPSKEDEKCPPTSGGTNGKTGYVGIASQGTAGDASKSVVAWYYPYHIDPDPEQPPPEQPVAPAKVAADGAILEGGGTNMNLPSVVTHGDLVLAAGNFDCNSNSTISGNVIVRNGSVSLSNQCTVAGSVYAKGDIQINNLGNHVTGDIVSATGNVTINKGSVNGSVRAGGTVTIQNSVTVGGDVVSAGTGQSSFYNATVTGSVSVAGTFSSFQTMTVGGNVTAAGTGTSAVAPDTTIQGNLKLGGDISTWNAGPTVKGTTTTKVGSGLPKPTVATPVQLTYPTWVEIPWDPSNWTGWGWTVTTASSSDCNYQSSAALVTAIDNLTQPTVIDATACGTNGLNLYGVTFNLKTDVTFIAKAFNSAQNITVNRTGSGSSEFNLIVPDTNASDNAPTCPSGAQSSTIYGAKLGAGVSGIAYSPCTLSWGTATWSGQLMAGYPDPSGGNATISYQQLPVPGALATGGGTTTITPPEPEPAPVQPPPVPVFSAHAPTQQTEPSWTP